MSRLVRAELRARALAVGALAAGSFLFLLAVASTYRLLAGAQTVTYYRARVPTLVAAFAGSTRHDIYQSRRYLAFGFNHPLFFVLTLAAGIWLGGAAVAGDVESGRSRLLYVRAVDRRQVLDRRVLIFVAAETLVVVAAFIGAVLGVALSPGLAGSTAGAARMALCYLPLAWLLGSVALVASAWTSRTATAIGVATAVVVAAYLLNFASLVWTGARAVHWLTPFGYYDPAAAASNVAWARCLVLTATAIGLVAVARHRVATRDLV